MGDFLGFKFGDIRTEDLGIIKVSDGDRYNEQLHPEIKDITAEVPGMDGEYYFGNTFGTRTFDLEIAYDSLTEEQFRKLRQVFGTKDIKKLIFDERPYKYYMVKIESPIELSYVCFDEQKKIKDTKHNGVRRDREKDQEAVIATAVEEFHATEEANTYTLENIPISEVSISPETIEYSVEDNVYTFDVLEETDITITYEYEQSPFIPAWEEVTPWIYEYKEDGTPITQRIYKGEGKITFKAYFPFAKSVYKAIPSEEEESDWVISSGMLLENDYIESKIDEYDNGIFKIYNPGDIETGFRLYCPFKINSESINYSNLSLTYKLNNEIIAELHFNNDIIEPIGEDEGFLIDTNNQLIVGITDFSIDTSGNVIYSTTGNLYNQYVNGGYFFKLQPTIDIAEIEVINGNENMEIFYDYLYF